MTRTHLAIRHFGIGSRDMLDDAFAAGFCIDAATLLAEHGGFRVSIVERPVEAPTRGVPDSGWPAGAYRMTGLFSTGPDSLQCTVLAESPDGHPILETLYEVPYPELPRLRRRMLSEIAEACDVPATRAWLSRLDRSAHVITDAWIGYYRCLVQATDSPRREEILEEMLAVEPDFVEARIALLESRLVRDRLEAASQLRAELEREYATDPYALYELAGILLRTGDSGGATDLLRRAADTQRAEPWMLVELASMLQSQGCEHETLVALERAAAGGCDDAEVHHRLARLLEADGRDDDALTHARRAVELDPHCSPAWTLVARAALDRGELDEAATALNRAFAATDEAGPALYMLAGRIRHALGDLDGATAAYTQALDGADGRAEPHRLLAEALAQRGQTAEAIGHLEAVVRIDRGGPQAEAARRRIEELCKRRRRSVESRFRRCGHEALHGDDPATAAADLSALLHERSDHWPTWYALGVARLRLGAHEEARQCFEEVLRRHGDQPDTLARLAEIDLACNRTACALPKLEKAFETGRDDGLLIRWRDAVLRHGTPRQKRMVMGLCQRRGLA